MARCSTCEATYEPAHETKRCGACRGSSPAPAWLDAPESEGAWWVRRPSQADTVVMITASPSGRLYINALDWLEPVALVREFNPEFKWQRVAPPREG